MLQNVPDLAVGVIFFTGLLIFSVIGGGLLQGSARSRNRKALAPLAAIIKGAVGSDHKSAWIDGEYRGRKILVTMTPNRNIAKTSDEPIKVNSFEISMANVTGAASWEIAFNGLVRKRWMTRASDEAVKGKLAQSILVSRLQSMPRRPSLSYEVQDRRLRLHEDVRPRRAPKPEHFRELLDLLFSAVEVNARVNPPRL